MLILWDLTQKLNGRLFLINFAPKGTKYEKLISVIEVLKMNSEGILKEKVYKWERPEFETWYHKLNSGIQV